jgi:hypothetical protein
MGTAEAERSSGKVSLEDWARGITRLAQQQSPRASPRTWASLTPRSNGPGRDDDTVYDMEVTASLRELLAPLVRECFLDIGRIEPPEPLTVPTALCVLAVDGRGRGDLGRSGTQTPTAPVQEGWSTYYVQACGSLDPARGGGPRRCSLVVDKLGVSVKTFPDAPGEINVDFWMADSMSSEVPNTEHMLSFPWSCIADVEPLSGRGKRSHRLAVRIREPAALGEERRLALTLELLLPDWGQVRQLADAALEFKSYEVQTGLLAMRDFSSPTPTLSSGATTLLLDEQGHAFWSMGIQEAEDEDNTEPLTPGDGMRLWPRMSESTDATVGRSCWC